MTIVAQQQEMMTFEYNALPSVRCFFWVFVSLDYED